MTGDARPTDAGGALREFLAAPTDAEAEVWLASVFGPDLDRVLYQATVRALGSRFSHTSAADDVAAEARLRLLARVREWRTRGEHDRIADFAGYAATVGFNAAYVFLRTRYPARTRLKNKVRYIVSRHQRLRVREDAAGQTVCEWAGPRPTPAPDAARLFRDDPQRFADTLGVQARGRPLRVLVADVVSRLDRAIALDELIDGLGVLIGIADDSPPASASPAVEDIAETTPDVTEQLEDRQYLERVWAAVAHLQPRQRAALLLNLRDPAGGSALQLVPLTGLASIREIAAIIDIPAAALARVWSALPFDDLQIGAHLGITRQQVINLRKTARATLARRLRDYR